MYKSKHTTNSWWESATSRIKVILLTAIATVLVIAAIIVNRKCSTSEEGHEVKIEETPLIIESIVPKGELYLCSAIIEEYVQEHRKERHFGLFPENHSCVQIVRQKCSYKIDLDKVEYIPEEDGTILVRLPKIEYVASTQNTPFMSDDEEFWVEELPNTNKLKEKVERKIRKRFDTRENRERAQRYAEESISQILNQLGYKCEFIPKITKKQETTDIQ